MDAARAQGWDDPNMSTDRRLRLTRIRVYPLKGAGGFDLQESSLDEFGIPGDRRWMLASPGGRFLSQRTHPRLCLLRTAPVGNGVSPGDGPGGVAGLPGEAGGEGPYGFRVHGPGAGSLDLGPIRPHRPMEVQVHGDRFTAASGNDEADRWFTDFLGEACRLVYMPDETFRPVDPDWAPGHRVGLADGYPLHLTTEESLLDLNGRLSRSTSMLAYRPNLVVAGGGPWEEDEWRALRIGGATFLLVKPCARCSVTTVDQGTGSRGREPLRALRAFRQWEGKLFFGQNAVIQEGGRFRVGDAVHILEAGHRRPPLPS
jgi:uncharacterized protein YcbX